MTYKELITMATAALLGAIATALLMYGACSTDPLSRSRLYRMHNRCGILEFTLAHYVSDLQDPKQQAQAAEDFLHYNAYEYDDIQLCSTMPLDLSTDRCWLAHDYECLAGIARYAHAFVAAEAESLRERYR